MTLVLDTCILIEVERRNPEIIKKLLKLSEDESDRPAITFATFSEFYYGFLRKFKHKQKAALMEIDKFRLLNSTWGSSKRFAELKFECERKGINIPLFYLMIASVVLEYGMTLVTSDKLFKKVPELKVVLLSC